MTLEQRRTLRGEAYNVAIKKLREMKGCGWKPTMPCSTDDDDIKAVKLLLQQFRYGIEAKDELLDKCIELGWIKTN